MILTGPSPTVKQAARYITGPESIVTIASLNARLPAAGGCQTMTGGDRRLAPPDRPTGMLCT